MHYPDEQKGEAQQQGRVHKTGKGQEAQRCGGDQDQALGGEQQAAAVHNISERPGMESNE